MTMGAVMLGIPGSELSDEDIAAWRTPGGRSPPVYPQLSLA
jgi:hypothetical protein